MIDALADVRGDVVEGVRRPRSRRGRELLEEVD
jgi:hypothetical protein